MQHVLDTIHVFSNLTHKLINPSVKLLKPVKYLSSTNTGKTKCTRENHLNITIKTHSCFQICSVITFHRLLPSSILTLLKKKSQSAFIQYYKEMHTLVTLAVSVCGKL